MIKKPSINDYSHSDFSSVKEFEEWRKNAITQLEEELDGLKEAIGEDGLIEIADAIKEGG